MRRLGQTIVAYLACVTLVMPLGWCCWLVPTVAQAEAVIETCCCCPAEKPAPAKPKPAETPRSCCKPTPAAFLTLPDDYEPAVSALPVALDEITFTQPRLHTLPAVVAIDSSPPLRVLHCLWLC